MDKNELKDLFINETEEYLQNLNNKLLVLENDPRNKELLDEIMRYFHTIKGSCATINYLNMAHLSHALEDIFDYARHDLLFINQEIMNEVFVALDALKSSMDSIKKDNKEAKLDYIIERIKAVSGVSTKGIGQSPRDKKGKPAIHENTKTQKHKNKKTPLKAVKDKNFLVNKGVDYYLEKFNLKEKSLSYIKIPIRRLDSLLDLLEELLIVKLRLQSLTSLKEIKKLNKDKSLENKELLEMKLEIDHLSSLIDNLQFHIINTRLIPLDQVLISFPRMVRDLAYESHKKIDFQILGTDLELDRSIVDKLSEPLIHLLRNASDHGIVTKGKIFLRAKRKKNLIVIEIEDDGRGIDWNRVVESSYERKIIDEKIKNKCKKILEDLKINKIKIKNQEEIVSLLFHPSLSTKKKITQTSGRGVGLSIVKKFIEKVNGNIIVESPINKEGGTRISLELPLTLAIIRVLLVSVGEHFFAIPFFYIEKVVGLNSGQIKSLADHDLGIIDKKRVPLINLRKILNLDLLSNVNKNNHNKEKVELPLVSYKNKTTNVESRLAQNNLDKKNTSRDNENSKVVVLRKHNDWVGIYVDKFLKEQEIIVKPLPGFLQGIKGFSGSTVLEKGQTVLIMDVNSLLSGIKASRV